ncbi:unknown [Odoribacter splanchnicus CAG:14]|nr:unknown [Odoribacter splanchnicus CAG:14]
MREIFKIHLVLFVELLSGSLLGFSFSRPLFHALIRRTVHLVIVFPPFLRNQELAFRNHRACETHFVYFACYNRLCTSFCGIDNCISQNFTGSWKHISRSGGKTPVKHVTVAANCNGIDRLGRNSSGNHFSLRRIEIPPRTTHHSDADISMSGVFVTIFRYPKHLEFFRRNIVIEFAILNSAFRSRIHFRFEIHLKRTVENRMRFIPVIGVVVETETHPIVLRT